MKFCPECGNELVGTEKFCPECGTNLKSQKYQKNMNLEEENQKFNEFDNQNNGDNAISVNAGQKTEKPTKKIIIEDKTDIPTNFEDNDQYIDITHKTEEKPITKRIEIVDDNEIHINKVHESEEAEEETLKSFIIDNISNQKFNVENEPNNWKKTLNKGFKLLYKETEKQINDFDYDKFKEDIETKTRSFEMNIKKRKSSNKNITSSETLDKLELTDQIIYDLVGGDLPSASRKSFFSKMSHYGINSTSLLSTRKYVIKTIKEEVVNNELEPTEEAIDTRINEILSEKGKGISSKFVDNNPELKELIKEKAHRGYAIPLTKELYNVPKDEIIEEIDRKIELRKESLDELTQEKIKTGFYIDIDRNPGELISGVFASDYGELAKGAVVAGVVNETFKQAFKWNKIKVLVLDDGFLFDETYIGFNQLVGFKYLGESFRDDGLKLRLIFKNSQNCTIKLTEDGDIILNIFSIFGLREL